MLMWIWSDGSFRSKRTVHCPSAGESQLDGTFPPDAFDAGNVDCGGGAGRVQLQHRATACLRVGNIASAGGSIGLGHYGSDQRSPSGMKGRKTGVGGACSASGRSFRRVWKDQGQSYKG